MRENKNMYKINYDNGFILYISPICFLSEICKVCTFRFPVLVKLN